eukprot:718183-Pelagomonas_calceolata.AAC.1
MMEFASPACQQQAKGPVFWLIGTAVPEARHLYFSSNRFRVLFRVFVHDFADRKEVPTQHNTTQHNTTLYLTTDL